jgi:hypothetical protein
VTTGPAGAEPSAGPTEEAAYARIEDHFERVNAELSELSPAAPEDPAATAIAKPAAPPIPHRKPQDGGDRSQEVVALLQQASATTSPTTADIMPSPPARTARAAVRPVIAAPPPSLLQRRQADEQSVVPDPQPLVSDSAAEFDPLVAALRRELRARDELIGSLLARVEQLERHVLLNQSQLDQVVAGAASPGGAADPLARPSTPPPSDQGIAQAQPASKEAPDQTPAPPAAPGQFEVDEEAVDRALERTLVQEGVLLLPVGQAEIDPSFSYTRREVDVPTFVAVNGDIVVGEQEVKRNEFVSTTALRFGLPFDSQIEVGIPYNYVDESVDTTVGGAPQTHNSEFGHGFGDLNVGLAKTLLQEGAGWWPDVIARVTWDADTGKTRDNGVFLGGGFNELSGSLSAVKRQDPLAFVGGVSYANTFENDDTEPGDEVGFSLGTVLAASPETSLSFFFNQTFADDTKIDGDKINGSDQVIGTFNVGAATILGRNMLLSVTGEIGLTDDAPDYAIGASLPIRFDLPVY